MNDIHIQLRTHTGRNQSKIDRSMGLIPATIVTPNTHSIHVLIPIKDVLLSIQKDGKMSLIIEDQHILTRLIDVHRHPISLKIFHIDLKKCI
jgi:ribosomal protein L25 (general stress protein Ctc)